MVAANSRVKVLLCKSIKFCKQSVFFILPADLPHTQSCIRPRNIYDLLCSVAQFSYIINFFSPSYHPLLPAFRREDHSTPTPTTPTSTSSKPSPSATMTTATANGGTSAATNETSNILVHPKEEPMDVNLDLVHALDIDFHHAMLPARPDILLLPSDLKPFAKVLCVHLRVCVFRFVWPDHQILNKKNNNKS